MTGDRQQQSQQGKQGQQGQNQEGQDQQQETSEHGRRKQPGSESGNEPLTQSGNQHIATEE